MPKHHAISLNYDHTADIFHTVRDYKSKTETAASVFRYLTKQSDKLNQLLLDIRHGFKAKLYSFKGEAGTTLYNASVRQSTRQELDEQTRRQNGHSWSTLRRLAVNINDDDKSPVTVSNHTLADHLDEHGAERKPSLEAGFTMDFDTCNDFDTYQYQTVTDHSRELIFKYQLEEFARSLGSESGEFIIVMDGKRELPALIKAQAKSLPSHITIKLVEFNWHQLVIEALGKETVDKLNLINNVLFNIERMECRTGVIYFTPQQIKKTLKQLVASAPANAQSDIYSQLDALYQKISLSTADTDTLKQLLIQLSDELIGDKAADIAQRAFSGFKLLETVKGENPVNEATLRV